MSTTNLGPLRIFLLVLGLIALAICGSMYASREGTFEWSNSNDVVVENSGILEDLVAKTTYDSLQNHLQFYLAANNIAGKHITFSAPSLDDGGGLSFNFKTEKDPTNHAALVSTVVYSPGVASIGVTIDEEAVRYAPVEKLYDASFFNFKTLTTNGLSAAQVYEIQTILRKSLESRSYSLSAGTVSQSKSGDSFVTDFDLLANGRKYYVRNVSQGIDDVDVTITSTSSGKSFHEKQSLAS